MKAIVIEIRSGLAHWRNPFSISVLETFLAPQKTSILGIVGAMAGLKEEEIEKLCDEVKVGVKIDEIRGISLDLTTLVNFKEMELKTPVARQLLVRPKYKLVICGGEEKISELEREMKKMTYPVYAGISEMLCEVEIKSIENVEVKKEKATFLNVSIPYADSSYEEHILPERKLIVPARVYKKTVKFEKKRKIKRFMDILEGFNVKIKPSWEVEFITIGGEHFPIF